MLKKGVMLLFFILSISTFSMVTHAANSSEYVNQSFYGYKEPSFNSAKTNGGSEYGAQNVGVMEKEIMVGGRLKHGKVQFGLT